MSVKNASEKGILRNESASQRHNPQTVKRKHETDTRQLLRPMAVKSRLWTCTEHNRFSGVVKLASMAPNHPTYNTTVGLNRRTFKNLLNIPSYTKQCSNNRVNTQCP